MRINIEGDQDGEMLVSVHGSIEGEDEARELLRVIREARTPVVLDLEELRTADTGGLRALDTLALEGARLIRASDFIKLLLESRGFTTSYGAVDSNGGAS